MAWARAPVFEHWARLQIQPRDQRSPVAPGRFHGRRRAGDLQQVRRIGGAVGKERDVVALVPLLQDDSPHLPPPNPLLLVT